MSPKEILLSNYTTPEYTITHVVLSFKLDPRATLVKSSLTIKLNTISSPNPPLILHGEDLKLLSVTVDGKLLNKTQFKASSGKLEIPYETIKKNNFNLECHTEINPEKNTSLEGLYLSNGVYCTQCEPEGFRKITYYLDRPDVLAKFRVRIEGDKKYLLSNGNLKKTGTGWAEWEDPWPKPSYLFALVGGNLMVVEDMFKTMSGKEVILQIYVEPGDENKCAHAMNSLKHSMSWDEQEYGREYDLDRFMIVAIQ
jgi:Aminopeptidase N